jgi:hypothetical protein
LVDCISSGFAPEKVQPAGSVCGVWRVVNRGVALTHTVPDLPYLCADYLHSPSRNNHLRDLEDSFIGVVLVSEWLRCCVEASDGPRPNVGGVLLILVLAVRPRRSC